MKANKIYHKSITRQFGMMVSVFVIIIVLLIGMFIWYQTSITADFEETNDKLTEKEQLANRLDDAYNLAISEYRGYFAYGENGKNKYYYEKGKEHQAAAVKAEGLLEDRAETNDDTLFLQDTKSFYQFYFENIIPKSVEAYEDGNQQYVAKLAVEDATNTVRGYQESLKDYRLSLNALIDDSYEDFKKKVYMSQSIFLAMLVATLFGLLVVASTYLRRIRKPLAELTHSAREIAAGNNVLFDMATPRQDELGLLHQAFSRMSRSIMEKEQDLLAQNEELHAQQDELQAQQTDLQETLDTVWERESQLKLRNELSNGISNSLNKQEVLTSIIQTMCSIIKAEQGVIITLDLQQDYAAFAVSEKMVEQLKRNLHSGVVGEVKQSGKPFMSKRECVEEEKGFHTGPTYCYDLYLPVVGSTGSVVALMAFSRYSDRFTEKEIAEYVTLTKNIALSLDKIKLYQLSEADRETTQHILNTIHEGIQLVDQNGTNLQINERMKKLLKNDGQLEDIPFENWVGQMSEAVLDAGNFVDFMKASIYSDSLPASNTFIYQMTDGSVMQVYMAPLIREKMKIGTVIVHRDITKEYQLDQMKSEFVSIVSHELRTPLASVLGFTELMLNKELKPERQKKYLSTIYQEGKRLTALINDFLDVQRMESGKQTYDKRYVDVVPLLESIMENQQVHTNIHTLRLEIKTDQSFVLGDKDKLSQVFTNLLNNAVKYSPDGGEINISVYKVESRLKVDVKDRGLGIPEDAIGNLFTKFYRVDNSDRRKIGGTGLGLAIVKEIVNAHEGDIDVVSNVEKGSTFTVWFPSAEAESNEKNAAGISGETAISHNRANVIVVEDDPNLATLLHTELGESGFNVKVFSKGTEAMAAIRKEKPDAVVLDIILEDNQLTGWDIIKKLKKDPDLAHIPIFISTALDEKAKGMALGANEFLVKPYQPSRLSKLILQTLLNKDRNGQIHIPENEE